VEIKKLDKNKPNSKYKVLDIIFKISLILLAMVFFSLSFSKKLSNYPMMSMMMSFASIIIVCLVGIYAEINIIVKIKNFYIKKDLLK
jgi:hypothetical protein